MILLIKSGTDSLAYHVMKEYINGVGRKKTQVKHTQVRKIKRLMSKEVKSIAILQFVRG